MAVVSFDHAGQGDAGGQGQLIVHQVEMPRPYPAILAGNIRTHDPSAYQVGLFQPGRLVMVVTRLAAYPRLEERYQH
ncbi:MAG: hypothetical protein A2514_07880 [Gammaproteobacteria bacterium RIFOXYD12_FULL_61_37]|nr:MAG: hypothetical protein A2514_07880 [Gammaproteobacteria bacterium RIFOXYD12_FULL_61_37]